jgi:predicted ArsR family transcriptional regulator
VPPDDVASVFSLGDPVRRGLYEYVVRRAEPVSRDEAAEAVGIGRSLAAYHLDRMVEDGLLEISFARRSGRSGPGAGRPAKLYVRSARQFQINLPPRDYEMAAHLLASAVEADGTGRARAALEETSRRLGRELAADVTLRRREGEGTDAATAVQDVLSERGYEPFSDGAGAIRLRNCPYDKLADAHRELICGMNLCVLDEVLAAVRGTGLRAVLDPQPGMCCVALLPKRSRRSRTSAI